MAGQRIAGYQHSHALHDLVHVNAVSLRHAFADQGTHPLNHVGSPFVVVGDIPQNLLHFNQ
jgi:hypothetical protein